MKEMEIKVSIIVPVYNLEKYIGKCIESILSQSLKEIEVLVIDDGSSDKSLEIIRDFEKKDSRIKVFSQENQGVSVARNNMLDHVKGEYIGFVDGDDYIDSDMYLKMYENAIETDSEIVIGGIMVAYEDTSKNKILDQVTFSPTNLLNNNSLILDTKGYMWNKLVKSELFAESKIKFDKNIKWGEDFLVSSELIINAKKISQQLDAIYYYLQRGDSVTSLNNKSLIDLFEVNLLLKKMLMKYRLYEKMSDLCQFQLIEETLFAIARVFYTEDKKEREGYIESIYSYISKDEVSLSLMKIYKKIGGIQTLKWLMVKNKMLIFFKLNHLIKSNLR